MNAYGSCEGVHDLIVTVEMCMMESGESDRFGRERMLVEHDKSAMDSSSDQIQHSSVSDMQSDILVV